MSTIQLDNRPRCRSLGPEYAGNGRVPCDLQRGHKGKHQWTAPMSGGYVEWK